MSCKLTVRERGSVTIVDSAGRITLGEGAGTLRDAIQQLVDQGKKKVILNLADTSYVDSTGICELVSGFTRLSGHGGVIKLLALSKKVKDLLQVTKLYTVFEVFEDEDAAVRSFG